GWDLVERARESIEVFSESSASKVCTDCLRVFLVTAGLRTSLAIPDDCSLSWDCSSSLSTACLRTFIQLEGEKNKTNTKLGIPRPTIARDYEW
ncbi:hypothetical protein KC19_1G188800, partial [Ceratodon purpureus]